MYGCIFMKTFFQNVILYKLMTLFFQTSSMPRLSETWRRGRFSLHHTVL